MFNIVKIWSARHFPKKIPPANLSVVCPCRVDRVTVSLFVNKCHFTPDLTNRQTVATTLWERGQNLWITSELPKCDQSTVFWQISPPTYIYCHLKLVSEHFKHCSWHRNPFCQVTAGWLAGALSIWGKYFSRSEIIFVWHMIFAFTAMPGWVAKAILALVEGW